MFTKLLKFVGRFLQSAADYLQSERCSEKQVDNSITNIEQSTTYQSSTTIINNFIESFNSVRVRELMLFGGPELEPTAECCMYLTAACAKLLNNGYEIYIKADVCKPLPHVQSNIEEAAFEIGQKIKNRLPLTERETNIVYVSMVYGYSLLEIVEGGGKILVVKNYGSNQ